MYKPDASFRENIHLQAGIVESMHHQSLAILKYITCKLNALLFVNEDIYVETCL